MQDVRPMTPEKILHEFDTSFLDTSPPSIDKGDVRDFLRTSLRALLLHVGEDTEKLRVDQIPELEGADADDCRVRNGTVDDCKRVIEKIISEI